MRLAVSRRGAIIERIGVAAFALVDGLLCDMVVLPELEHTFLAFDEVEVRVYFLIQNVFLPSSATLVLQNTKTCILIGYRFTSLYYTTYYHVPAYASP